MNAVVDLKHNQHPTIEDRFELIRGYDRQAYFDKGRELKAIRDRMHTDKKTGFEELCEIEVDIEIRHVYRLIDAYMCAEKLCHIMTEIPTKERQVAELLKLKDTGHDDEHRADVWRRCLDSGQKITARFIAEQVQKKLAELSKNWITLEEWKDLSEAEKADALNRSSSKTFNKQDNASIEWAQWSWNPITGCLHDCPYCYARDIAERFYPDAVGFSPAIYPDRFPMAANTAVPDKAQQDIAYKNVFTCSMADLFGRWVPAEWIAATLAAAAENAQWNFLFLTKFPKRMAEFDIPENCWMGTSVDCQARVKNAERAFANVTSGVKWLSVEPMLEPLKFERLDLFDWIVIGGASSSNKTPAWVPPIDWIFDLHQQAREAGCKIYYKTNCGMTDDLRIKEFPWIESVTKQAPSVFQYLGKAKVENQKAEQ